MIKERLSDQHWLLRRFCMSGKKVESALLTLELLRALSLGQRYEGVDFR